MVFLQLIVGYRFFADRAHAYVARAMHAVNSEVHAWDLAFAENKHKITHIITY